MSEDVKKQSKLREYYAYKGKLTERLEKLTKQKYAIDTEISDINGKLAATLGKINYIEGRELLISTHALERYRERIDPTATDEQIHARITTPSLLHMIATLGNGIYPVEDFQVVIQDNKVVTVRIEGRRHKPAHAAVFKETHIKPRKRGKR